MWHGPKHRINIVKEDDRIIAVMEQRREQTQWRDVAVDQDRFDAFFLQGPKDGSAFAKPALSAKNEQGVAHFSRNQPNMVR